MHCITTHDTSSVLRDILYHYYIIVVGRSGPWREEGKIESCQNQFCGTLCTHVTNENLQLVDKPTRTALTVQSLMHSGYICNIY